MLTIHSQVRRNRWLRSRRRGSALLIVLALLSVLVLLAATLAFTSRIEVLSSRNFARAVQNRTAALTGVEASAKSLAKTLPKGALGPVELAQAQRTANGLPATASKNLAAPLQDMTDVRISDLSARLNINTASKEELSRFFAAVSDGTVDSDKLAAEIVAWRLGPDGAPGKRSRDDNKSARFSLDAAKATESVAAEETPEAPRRAERLRESCYGATEQRAQEVRALRTGEDEKGEYVSDIRYPAFGDDRRFGTVADLAAIKGMTPELLKAAEPQLTTFSVALPAGTSADNSRDRVDINRATAEDIYNALKQVYGSSKDDNLLRQFAVNTVDARDTDMVPTEMADSAGAGKVIGIERAPFITEVYPESRSESPSDDGEFVEIYNPWGDPIALDGWSLAVGGLEVSLAGTLPSKGFLIVTDNYNTRAESDQDLPGLGSFYDVHGVVSTPPSRRILEFPLLDLTGDRAGTYSTELRYDGKSADWFQWQITAPVSTSQSFQREGGGQTRTARLAPKTPFGLLTATAPDKIFSRALYGPQDVPYTSTLQLFEVFAGFAPATGGKGLNWAFPVVASPDSPAKDAKALAEDSRTIDARIVDIFTVEESARPVLSELQKELESGDVTGARRVNAYEGEIPFNKTADGKLITDEAQLEALLWQRYALPAAGTRLGLVNINTASEAVLVGVGLDQDTAAKLVGLQRKSAEKYLEGESDTAPVYGKLSAILVDDRLWGDWDGDLCDRLAGFAKVADRVTINSQSFLLEGQALERTQSGGAGKAALKMQAAVALDNAQPQLVAWDFVP